jgi:ABC transporter substrate binding protein (PQQ-dependent alcohol dehydrogenase system)
MRRSFRQEKFRLAAGWAGNGRLGAALVAVALASAMLPAAAQDAAPATPSATPAAAAKAPADIANIKIGVLKQAVDAPVPLSLLDIPPADDGFSGARLAAEDNNTTGRFMKQHFDIVEVEVPVGGDAVAALRDLLAQDVHFIVTLAPADTVLALADAAGDEALLLNAGAPDDRLRGEDCRANVLHLGPSRAMLADALAQYLMWKRWDEWFLIRGSHPNDELWAAALQRAATRFGAKVVEERVYEDTGGSRRTDTGHVQVQKQIPVFTQRAEDHDVIVVADESEIFGEYLPYRTWEPSLVTGSAGLVPASWHPAHEQWGATQLQNRFVKKNNRTMRPLDYQAWMAVRTIGEAATRSKSVEYAPVRDYIKGPDFNLAAFKGLALTFRPWDGQLRQPVILGTPKLPVTVSPQEGYLHKVTELDTLGFDQPESACKL